MSDHLDLQAVSLAIGHLEHPDVAPLAERCVVPGSLVVERLRVLLADLIAMEERRGAAIPAELRRTAQPAQRGLE